MKRRSWLWFVAPLFLALLAGFIAIFTLRRAATQETPGAAMTGRIVVVARQPIAVNSTIRVDNVVSEERSSAPSGAAVQIQDVVGRVTLRDIAQGEVILMQDLTSEISGTHNLPRLLGDDKIAVALPADDILSKWGAVVPGDHVDVLTPSGEHILGGGRMLTLARWACAIEDHYGRPMDIEWARDGVDGKLYIVQARPETVKSRADGQSLQRYELKNAGEVIVTGRSIGGRGAVDLDLAQAREGVVRTPRIRDANSQAARAHGRPCRRDAQVAQFRALHARGVERGVVEVRRVHRGPVGPGDVWDGRRTRALRWVRQKMVRA